VACWITSAIFMAAMYTKILKMHKYIGTGGPSMMSVLICETLATVDTCLRGGVRGTCPEATHFRIP